MKTMVVFTKFRKNETDEWIETYEVAEIGKKATNPQYKTGTSFIAAIKKMYHTVGFQFKITNVVIG